MKNKGGRPTIYTTELADTICGRIANGESVVSIGKDPEMPDASTVYDWAYHNAEFSEKYANARQQQAEHLFDELLEIADDNVRDKEVDEEGNERVNSEVVNRSRLRIDTRKWYLSKVLPKKFADRQYQDITSDGEQLKTINVIKADSEHNSDTQADKSVGDMGESEGN